MGMYDELRTQYPLPVPEVQGETFQTKSLGCDLAIYTILEDGSLIVASDGEEVVIEDIHKDVIFYTRHEDEWYEFRARFTDGKCKWIRHN